MEPVHLHPDQTIAELLAHWPAIIAVFLRRRMACVGCVMARFETLHEVAASYHISADDLCSEIRIVIGSTTATDAS